MLFVFFVVFLSIFFRLYLCPVRGWRCSCHSLCPQIQRRAAWGVSSQWSGCVRSWWDAAGSESTGWRSGSVLQQVQLWQCVWQWGLAVIKGVKVSCVVQVSRVTFTVFWIYLWTGLPRFLSFCVFKNLFMKIITWSVGTHSHSLTEYS